MGSVAEYNLKDMTFHEIRNVLLHWMDDTGELPEFPWQVSPHVDAEALAFLAGLFWFSTHTQRIRYTASAYTYDTRDDIIVHDVARVKHFIQGVLTDTWEIEHNFGGEDRPAVLIYDEDDVAIDAAVTHVDENNTTLTFTEPITGRAVLLG